MDHIKLITPFGGDEYNQAVFQETFTSGDILSRRRRGDREFIIEGLSIEQRASHPLHGRQIRNEEFDGLKALLDPAALADFHGANL